MLPSSDPPPRLRPLPPRIPLLPPALRRALAGMETDRPLTSGDWAAGFELARVSGGLRALIHGVWVSQAAVRRLRGRPPTDFADAGLLSPAEAAEFLALNPGLVAETPDPVALGVGWWLLLAGERTLTYVAPELQLVSALVAVSSMRAAMPGEPDPGAPAAARESAPDGAPSRRLGRATRSATAPSRLPAGAPR